MSHSKTAILILTALFSHASIAQQCEAKIEELQTQCPEMVEAAMLPDPSMTLHTQRDEMNQRASESRVQYIACLEAQTSCMEKCGTEFRNAKMDGNEDLAIDIQEVSRRCNDYQIAINSLKTLEANYRTWGNGITERLKPMKGHQFDRATGHVTALQTLPSLSP